jgi:hypothetical protein
MAKYKGGSPAPRGLYFNVTKLELINQRVDNQLLPGNINEKYFKINLLILVGLAPILGLSLVIFMPPIGMVVSAIFILGVFAIFTCQKVACKLMRKICKAEGWLCEFIKERICQTCTGKSTCDDNAPMLARAIIAALGLLLIGSAGFWLGQMVK